MVSPKTFKGYNEKGEVLSTVPAENANNYINPVNVQNAINNVETVAKEGFDLIKKALSQVEPDASEAIIVQGTKMTAAIEETGKALDTLPRDFKDSISVLYDESVKAHDQLQNEFNDQARAAAKIAGVTIVREG